MEKQKPKKEISPGKSHTIVIRSDEKLDERIEFLKNKLGLLQTSALFRHLILKECEKHED